MIIIRDLDAPTYLDDYLDWNQIALADHDREILIRYLNSYDSCLGYLFGEWSARRGCVGEDEADDVLAAALGSVIEALQAQASARRVLLEWTRPIATPEVAAQPLH